MDKLREKPDKPIQFDSIIETIRQYNLADTFLWLQIVASHPSNQIYAGRFDLLNSLLLSLPHTEFANKPFSRADCCELLKLLNDNYGERFVSVEDYEPFNQLKLIPYFFEGAKYYEV